jgi:maltose alpha-D-glucosyltransferase / alpha-amylase
MVTPEEREFMWEYYAPQPRMRLNLGIRRRLAPLLSNNPSWIKLANSILLTLIGSPFLYYGDEIGMGDNIWLDDRGGLRTPMQWDGSRSAGFSTAAAEALYALPIQDGEFGCSRINVQNQRQDQSSLLNWIRQALRIRGQHLAFGRGGLKLLNVQNQSILAYLRHYGNKKLLVLNNLSTLPQHILLDISALDAHAALHLFGSHAFAGSLDAGVPIELGGLDFHWFELG